MMVVARESKDGKPVNLAEVADRAHISRRYLEQVAISLKNAGLLKAVSGKNGGHLLGRPADQISLGQIVEAAMGPINIVDCVANPDNCLMVETCECRSVYQLINSRIKGVLDSFSLADLAESRVKAAVAKQMEMGG
jgi:Rrf2 family transcriptional regulator, iron-sulfur cluster assembly transcription factor